ncbi:hypothetical protein [Chlorobium phaeobacteroides]|uniref:Uncharacterized protein n=1 Tax=Chlorobium phaeobacteroides (strain DSM 266 / SMG 266 / 2430) TaxID=290317 RepID=A1BHZ0_CHLPD|nr:hypothetical protein [Chlorobium phaeobacteroides]ABL66017.1 conserved hypothetical protein [Chlorobium phaeobacteroides DSM 266]
MKYGFTSLWNIMFAYVGPSWLLLVWMIWSSGQLKTPDDHMIYLAFVIPGFVVIYLSGFIIERWHNKKQQQS